MTDLVTRVPHSDDRWVLEQEGTPETPLHELIIGLLVDVLRA